MPIHEALKQKIDFKTKPLGALGQLEDLAMQIGAVQNTLTPKLIKPAILVFAADHGIAEAGVSAYPADVTVQMVLNFLKGGAAINVFCRQHQLALHIIDAGVNFDFTKNEQLIDAKIAYGTRNFLHEKAMTTTQLQQCFEKGGQLVNAIANSGCNIIGFGEMGIGNTSSASMLMSCLTNIPLEQCVGKGTGLTAAGLQRKLTLLKQAQAKHANPKDAKEALMFFGGFEIAQICAAMLNAYENNMLIMVDGFIATVAYLCAKEINNLISSHAIFCHESNEQGHRHLLSYIGAKPLVNLGMRVGEGTGCALAYPIIQSAVLFLEEMASFESANISSKI
ncbi:nicotinate-nucleotide--dimethylbenzimidazole phosphoribosyltransferase [Pedobacter sp. CG_S7]|uniref:nicotinate-nucleotide--dimethylbenzimidazole phosphoribosyltransferase n=1 Tax=Pedobacter sp. CG_S7 TaxID=3143930 RepID=UPI0033972D05